MNIPHKAKSPDLPVSFKDTAVAFQHKSDRELLLSYLIFGLTKSPFLVKFLSQAAKLTLALGLPVKPLIKATVFKQFCGGEEKKEYSKVITKLGRAAIGTILDYSVEGSEDEAGFEATTKQLLQNIEQSKSNPNIPCTCMKMTAIGSFDIFKKITAGDPLSKAEQHEWQKVKDRVEKIGKASYEADKPIYIDVVEICVGTHNEESCELLVQSMAENKLPNDHPQIYFSQLFGMSDNISFNLAKAGYNVSKYLPFGPVESTLPYLARRAEENTAIAGQMSKELETIAKERKRRRSA